MGSKDTEHIHNAAENSSGSYGFQRALFFAKVLVQVCPSDQKVQTRKLGVTFLLLIRFWPISWGVGEWGLGEGEGGISRYTHDTVGGLS